MGTSHRARTIIYVLALFAVVLSTTGSLPLFSSGSIMVPLTAKAEFSIPSPEFPGSDSLAYWSVADGSIRLQPHRLPFVPDSVIDNETLWLARCIYSETKRPEEQELIAWVVRNRVEALYRGKLTYRDVILDPFQFSAFNPDDPKAAYYSAIPLSFDDLGWRRALSIAHYVRHARPQYRPFSAETLHFYSLQSMIGQREPTWARGLTPISPPEHYGLDERRFRFFAGIS